LQIFQDKGGVVEIGGQVSKFRIVPNRPSKKEIKSENEAEIKEEIPTKKSFEKIRVRRPHFVKYSFVKRNVCVNK
jgi:hypothetical protein